jgi:hypothetical protein
MWEQVKQALVDSTTHFLTRFANLLPGLAALILALLVSAALAWILAASCGECLRASILTSGWEGGAFLGWPSGRR